mmetsp:Transcript_62383/g.184590  ORF Transcript_62383/g.184590 Transcript_62383/m.184590 type:complete len:119 (-) Transcript_62383:83-439(-)
MLIKVALHITSSNDTPTRRRALDQAFQSISFRSDRPWIFVPITALAKGRWIDKKEYVHGSGQRAMSPFHYSFPRLTWQNNYGEKMEFFTSTVFSPVGFLSLCSDSATSDSALVLFMPP